MGGSVGEGGRMNADALMAAAAIVCLLLMARINRRGEW